MIVGRNPFIRLNWQIFIRQQQQQQRQYSRMQTPITAFFKAKEPKKEASVEEENICHDDQKKDDNKEPEPKTVNSLAKTKEVAGQDNDSDDEDFVVGVTKKRRAIILESDDEDEVVVKETNKRRAVTLESDGEERPATPKKDDAVRPEVLATANGDSNKTPVKAVVESKTSTPAKPMTMSPVFSPMMSVEALVKKKISSGCYALHENIGPTWFRALQPEFDKPYFKKLSAFVDTQRKSNKVYPSPEQVFTWTHYHTIRDTRVVVIGQDPYHGPGQAHGLSFSVQKGVAIPKSLQNIYKELKDDIADFKHPSHGNLTGWAKQGVLMLNACLTVNQGNPNSHQGKGWENLTDAVISWISKNVKHNVVFLLWGRFAQKKSSLIEKRHKILTAAHPSPFSADSGFFGCKHFSKTNEFLRSQKLSEINWTDL